MFLSHGSIVKYKNQLLEYMKHTFELLFYGIYTDIQEFLNVKKSMVALLTPKCVSKYAMLDCIEGNDPTWVAVILSGSKDTVAEKGL